MSVFPFRKIQEEILLFEFFFSPSCYDDSTNPKKENQIRWSEDLKIGFQDVASCCYPSGPGGYS